MPRNEPSDLRRFNLIVDNVALVCFTAMIIAVFAQVIFRYALKISVPWTEEFARLLFTWVSFLGAAIALRKKEHIFVDVILRRLPKRLTTAIALLFLGIILIFHGFLLWGALCLMRITWTSYMPALDWMRTAYLYLGFSITLLITIVYVALALCQQSRRQDIREKKSSEADY